MHVIAASMKAHAKAGPFATVKMPTQEQNATNSDPHQNLVCQISPYMRKSRCLMESRELEESDSLGDTIACCCAMIALSSLQW